MSDIPAGAERLPHDHLSSDPLRFRSPWFRRPASSLLCNGSVHNKAVRFGSLDPAHVTLAKRSIQPAVVVVMLAICMLACGRTLSSQFYALGLAAFLTAAQVFSPLDWRNRPAAERNGKSVSRILLEWSCVAAILVFLSASFKLTHLFSRDLIVSWLLLTPLALLLVDSLRNPLARLLAADRGLKLAVNQNGRWAPHFSYMAAAIRAGLIGEVGIYSRTGISSAFITRWPCASV